MVSRTAAKVEIQVQGSSDLAQKLAAFGPEPRSRDPTCYQKIHLPCSIEM
jgi:hypothetical protein